MRKSVNTFYTFYLKSGSANLVMHLPFNPLLLLV
jgi:hypothetical protein